MSAIEKDGKYFFTTGLYCYVGKVESADAMEIVLVGAARIYDTGRFSEFITNGTADNMEVEAIPDKQRVIIMRHNIQDIIEWPHALLRETV